MEPIPGRPLVSLDVDANIWSHVFTVAPLVVVGSIDPDGSFDLAPKHMVTPLGWGNYFGFVCTPMHRTYHNVRREGVFTVTYVRPTQVVLTSLTASPRADGPGSKPALRALPTFPADIVSGVFLEDGYFFLECELDKIVDDFGDNSLIAGRIIAAYAHEDLLRTSDTDDAERVLRHPLFAYLHPGRYAEVAHTYAFPYPAGFIR